MMTIRSGRGLELMEMLRRELGVPEQARWFEVRFAVDEVVTVKCEYLPRETKPVECVQSVSVGTGVSRSELLAAMQAAETRMRQR